MKFKGTTGTGTNIAEHLQANHSYISSYLVEADYFNGFGNKGTQKPKSFNGNYLKNQNLTLNGYSTSIALAPQNSVSTVETEFITKALDNELRPEDLPSTAIKYGFIYGIEYLTGYRTGPAGTLMKRPVWKQLTKNILSSMQRVGNSMLCRQNRRTTYWAFNGIEAPLYNELFILGPAPNRAPPTGIKGFSILALGVSQTQQNAPSQPAVQNMEIVQFANTYDPSKRMISRYTTLTRIPGGGIKQFSQLAGRTTYNDGHYHEYIIDKNGNGVAKEACNPTHPNVCHDHKIVAGVVQSGQSTSIDPSVGAPPHVHKLPQAATTTAAQTTTSAGPTTTATGTTTTTGGGSSTGGY